MFVYCHFTYTLAAGTDYIGELVPGVLAFPTNSTSGTIQCAEFGIIDDNTLEGEHNFTVNISSTSPEISVDTPYEATVLIQDNDRKQVLACVTKISDLTNNLSLQVPPWDLYRHCSMFWRTFLSWKCVWKFPIYRQMVSSVILVLVLSSFQHLKQVYDFFSFLFLRETLICDHTIHPCTVQGIDFEVSGSLELNFPYTGTVNGDEQCVNITIEDDMILEGQHIVQMQLALGSPEGLIDFNPSFSSVIIADNDGGSLYFTYCDDNTICCSFISAHCEVLMFICISLKL